jgi:type III restriction enzyme
MYKGNRTMVLNDEVHHISYSDENEWKKFIELIQPLYNIGVSGTCYYKDGGYFTNIIYRYSLRQAIDDGWVKNVDYIVKENLPNKADEKWQVIINKHNEIKTKLTRYGILPMSIVVTDKTDTCDNIAKQFKGYLKTASGLTDDEVNEKVIVVHSKANVASDRLKLKSVDSPISKVEWIFSVFDKLIESTKKKNKK